MNVLLRLLFSVVVVSSVCAQEPLEFFRAVSKHEFASRNLDSVRMALNNVGVKKCNFYDHNKDDLDLIISARPATLFARLPIDEGRFVDVELHRHEVFTQGVKIIAASGKTIVLPSHVSYTGKIVDGEPSFVALTFFPDRVACLISNRDGNYIIGKQNEYVQASEHYVGYKTSDLNIPRGFTCGVVDDSVSEQKRRINSPSKSNDEDKVQAGTGDCKMLLIWLELTHEICYDHFANDTEAILEYVSTLFNLVAAFYRNEAIAMEVGVVYLWDTANDPYANDDRDQALSDFEDTGVVPSYGNLAVLLTTNATDPPGPQSGRGGLAELPTCFDSFCDGWYSYADVYISSFVYDVPLYDWDVMVVAHEIGHNLNARHTHWCGWIGGALDDCGPSETYYTCPWPGVFWCSDGPTPGTDEGRVMSYCHLSGQPGINFALGLHDQVGDRMREFIEDDDGCLVTITSDWVVQNQQFPNFSFTQLEWAPNTLYVGRSVTTSIPDGDVVVRNDETGEVEFVAGVQILIEDGFRTESSVFFHARIDPALQDCDESFSSKHAGQGSGRTIRNSGPGYPVTRPLDELEIAPNPASDDLAITYTIVASGMVKVDIVNLFGQSVGLIKNEVQTKGQYTAIFDCTFLNNGTYFVRFRTQAGVILKSVIVNR